MCVCVCVVVCVYARRDVCKHVQVGGCADVCGCVCTCAHYVRACACMINDYATAGENLI
jgi:hypothetical protein